MTSSVTVRPARREDVGTVLALIRGLAEYEREPPESVQIGEAELLRDGFDSDSPRFHVLLAEDSATTAAAGFALYYRAYSTWQGRVLYLEDIFVLPQHRCRGVGAALFRAVAQAAADDGCARLTFQCLDWNESARRWYESFAGAAPLPEWVTYRMGRPQIDALLAQKKKGCGRKMRSEVLVLLVALLCCCWEGAEGWTTVCGSILDRREGACPAGFRHGHALASSLSSSSSQQQQRQMLFVFGGATLATQVVGGDARPRSDLWRAELSADGASADWAELTIDWRERSSNWTLDCGATAVRPAPRSGSVVARLPDGSLLLAGGQCGGGALDDLWHFGNDSAVWTRLALHTTQLRHSAGVVWEGTLFLFGGIDPVTSACSDRLFAVPIAPEPAVVEVAREGAADWPEARAMHTAVLYNGSMVVFGGYNGSSALNDMWMYSFATGHWTKVDSSSGSSDAWPAGRFAHAAAVCDPESSGVDRAILAVHGGMRSQSQVFSDLYTFDFATRTWAFRTNEGRSRAFAAVACAASRVWVFGGSDMQAGVFGDLVSFPLTCI